jgi:hypothetical protein
MQIKTMRNFAEFPFVPALNLESREMVLNMMKGICDNSLKDF